MLAIGIQISLVGGARAAAFTPASLSPAAWYDPSDLSTLFRSGTRASPGAAVTADGDPVGLMLDKSGNGLDLAQSTAANKPLYKTSAGLSWLQFDGTNDCLISGTISLAQPFDRVSALRQSAWVSGNAVIGQSAGNLWQKGSTPQLQLGVSAATLRDGDLAIGADGVVSEHWEGASSSLQVNNGTVNTGDAGTTAAAPAMSIGATVTGPLPTNMRYYGGLVRSGTMTAAQLAALKTYLGAKCGVVV